MQIILRLLQQGAREGDLVFIQLLRRKAGHDAAQVALKRFLGDMANIVLAFADQAFNCIVNSGLITGDLDVGNPCHIQGNPPLGVGVFHPQFDDHVAEVEAHHVLQNGDAQGTATANGAIPHLAAIARGAAEPREDQHFTGLADEVKLPEHHNKRPEPGSAGDSNGKKHQFTPVEDRVPIKSMPRMSLT